MPDPRPAQSRPGAPRGFLPLLGLVGGAGISLLVLLHLVLDLGSRALVTWGAGVALAVTLAGAVAWILLRRKEARDRTVRERDARLDAAVAELPAVLWRVDRELTFVVSEGAGLEGLGLEPGEVEGTTLQEFFGSDDPDLPPLAAHRRALEGEAVTYDFEWEGRAYRAHVRPSRDRDGGIDGVLGIALDVTRRRRAEEALSRSEERYRELLEQASDAIFVTDEEGVIEEANRRAYRILGYADGTLAGVHVRDLMLPEELEERPLRIPEMRAGSSIIVERRLRTADGGTRRVEFGGTQLEDGRLLGIARDLTDRKRLEERVRRAEKMEVVGNLAGGVAHDFNNLLTAIEASVGLALERVGGDDPVREELEEIAHAARRAEALIRRLLAFGRKEVVQPRDLDVNDVIAGLEGMLGHLLGDELRLEVDRTDEPAPVHIDPGQLEQVVMNLVLNARDAMPGGGTLLIRTAVVELGSEEVREQPEASRGRHVRLTVEDTGEGIPPEVRSRIFEPFYTRKGEGGGTGLGLATVYGIVKQNRGHLEVESAEGEGTAFHVFLPRSAEAAPEADAGTGAPGRGAPEEAELRGSERILVVEDEEAVLRAARRGLERFGYGVTAAASGEEALEACEAREGDFDLILTDVVMPGMSGTELADLLSRRFPDLDVLFMSGYTEDTILRHGISRKETAFLPKPFTPVELASKVREVFDGR